MRTDICNTDEHVRDFHPHLVLSFIDAFCMEIVKENCHGLKL